MPLNSRVFMELTAAQILEYNAPNAFATTRTQPRGFNPAGSGVSSSLRLRTQDISESYRLLSGSVQRVNTIETNLTSMLELAQEGGRASTSAERLAEIHGLMRSLSAGIDIVVDQTRFNGQQVLDGRSMRLAGAGSSTALSLKDLSASGGLGLAETGAGAEMKIWYDDYSTWRNSSVGLIGLDLSAARSADISAGSRELENGTYDLEIVYGGPESSLILRDIDGVERGRVDRVDLSGSGVERVKFDLGIEIEVEKQQVVQSVDKYDYELLGKPSLFAKLNYQRITTHSLEGAAELTPRTAGMEVEPLPVRGLIGGTFGVVSAGVGPIPADAKELASGQYRVEVVHRGFDSSAFLYSVDGRAVAVIDDLDLSADGPSSVDFGNGLTVTVNNDGFTGTGTQTALVNYQQATQPSDGFDFKAFAKKVQSALDVVGSQRTVLETAQEQVNLALQGASGTLPSAQTSSAATLLGSLLGSNGGGTSLFSSETDVDAQLDYTMQMILNPLLNAGGTQANQDSGSLLSLFSSSNSNSGGTTLWG